MALHPDFPSSPYAIPEAGAVHGGTSYRFVYVDQEGFERHRPTAFAALAASFHDFQEDG